MYVLPLCFFFPRGIPEGYLFFFFSSVFASAVWHWLVGRAVKSMEMPPGCGMFLAVTIPVASFSPALFASEGYPRGLFNVFNQLIVTAVLLLRMLPWGGEGFCCTDKGVKAPGVVFLPPQVRGVSEAWQSPAFPQERHDRGRSGLCCKGKSGTRKRDTVGSQGCPCTL